MEYNKEQEEIINSIKGRIQVIASAGSGKCIKGDSYIYTEKGMYMIKDLYNSFKNEETNEVEIGVLSLDLAKQKIIKNNTSHLFNMGKSKTIKITTSQGYEIEGTPEHPIIILNKGGEIEFKQLKNITKEDIIVISTNNNLWGKETNITEELSYIIGVILGNGGNIDINKTDKYLYSKYKELISNIDINILTENKEIPQTILNSPSNIVKRCLQGLFDIGGTITDNIFKYSTNSKEMIKQIQMLLLNFGIISKVRHSNYLYITGDNIRIFYDKIGFRYALKKQKKLEKSLKRHKGSDTEYIKLLNNNFFFDKIAEIKDSESIVYDFTVPDTHSFIGNGFINHNTTVLVNRINNIVTKHNTEQEDILAISFTNASANDLKKKLNEKGINNVTTGTFHSICKKLLESKGIDTNTFPNKYQVSREISNRTKEKEINIEDILSWISYQQAYNKNSESEEYKYKESIYTEDKLRIYYKIYEEYKEKTKSLDFGDWLIEVNKLYEEGKIDKHWKYVLVDENQDSNYIQHKLIEHFANEEKNISIIGDYRQSIYSFNGGIPELFLSYDKEHKDTKVINLYTNYRSKNNIVEMANKFIEPYYREYEHYRDAEAYNKENGEIKKKIFSTKEEEAKEVVKKIQEIIDGGTKLEDIAVLYRNNATSSYVETELKRNNIEYICMNNSSFYDRVEIKGIIGTLRLIKDITDDEALEIVLNSRFYPCTYFKKELIEQLRVEAGKKDISLYEALREHKFSQYWERKNVAEFSDCISSFRIQRDKGIELGKLINNIIKSFKIIGWINSKYDTDTAKDKIEGINNLRVIANSYKIDSFINFIENGGAIRNKKKGEGIRLTTIHKSKGLEYDTTFIIGLERGQFPSEKADIESEARLMYVAVTRAKERIYLSSIGDSLFYRQYRINE